MSLDLAFGIARSGLLTTQRQLAQVSQNIANADTPGYTRKELPQTAATADNNPLGLRFGEAQRTVDQTLLAERDARGAEAAGAGVRERLLSRIEAVHGRPGDADSIADTMGKLRESAVSLRAAPADTGLQMAVSDAARLVATRFNEVGRAVTAARQEAQDGILGEVGELNRQLRAVADLTTRIRAELAHSRSAADLEDERDLALGKLSATLPVQALRHADGDITLVARNGIAVPLPLPRGADPFAVAPALIGPTSFYGPPPAGSIGGITLDGVDVTPQLRGGRLGEYVALRDGLLPRMQAEVDIAAATLATRLEQQGLRLFVAGGGAPPDPAAGYVAGGVAGFANVMRVNPDVLASPRLIRDGTHDIAGPPATAADAFTVNPAGGPAGFSRMLDRVLEHGFGETVRAGTSWGAIPTAALGPAGNLLSPFTAPRSVEAYAAAITGAHGAERAQATALRERAELFREGLDARFRRQSGVDTDAEMAALIRLQNAYAANARVVNTAQQMLDALMAMGR